MDSPLSLGVLILTTVIPLRASSVLALMHLEQVQQDWLTPLESMGQNLWQATQQNCHCRMFSNIYIT